MDPQTGTSVADPHQAPDRQATEDEPSTLDALEADQLTAAKHRRFGRRRLGLGTRALLWALRLYVLLMLMVVVARIVQAVNGG